MEGNIRVPGRLKRYFSSMCLVSVFMMVLVGPGAIISVLGQTMSFFNITNLLGSVGNLIESLAGIGKGGPCQFKCPDGSKPQPNPVHASTTNGCGAFGFQIDSQLFPAVTQCCETHDFCYDICNSNKSVCDSQFQDCLKLICKDLHKATGGTELYEGCVSIAALAYKTTVAVGCKTFQRSQSNACICGGGPGGDGGGGDSGGGPGGGRGGGGSNRKSPSSQYDHRSKSSSSMGSDASAGDSASAGSESERTFKQMPPSPPPGQNNDGSDSKGSTAGRSRGGRRDGDGGSAKEGNGYARRGDNMKGHLVYNHADIVRANTPPPSPHHGTQDSNSGTKDDDKRRQRGKAKAAKNNHRRGNDNDDDDDDDDDDDNDDHDSDNYNYNDRGKKMYGGKRHGRVQEGGRRKDEF